MPFTRTILVAAPPHHDKRDLGTRNWLAKIDDVDKSNYDRLVKLFTKLALQGLGAAKLQRAVELINPHLYTVEERIREQAKAFDPAIEGFYGDRSRDRSCRPQ